MPIVGAAFLLAVGRALTRIDIEHDDPRRSPPVHLVDPLAGQIGESGEVLGRVGYSVSKRAIWLVEAADPVIAVRRPPSVSPDPGTADRRHSYPHSRPNVRTLTVASSRSQAVSAVLAGPPFGEQPAGHVGQTDRIIQLAIGSQPGIGRNRGATKSQHQPAVEIDPQRTPTCFTRRVRYCRSGWFSIRC